MSGTISISQALQVVNGELVDQFIPNPQTITETNVGVVGGSYSITTSAMNIPNLSGLTAEGWCVMQNLDPTNYVTWGPSNSGTMVPVGKLKPGESIQFRVAPSAVLMAQANTAAVLLLCRVWED